MVPEEHSYWALKQLIYPANWQWEIDETINSTITSSGKGRMSPESRKFLVKQGHDSVVVGLDLIGMDDELAVLSGRAETTGVAREVIAELGNDPKLWLPEFHRRRRPS